jgi:hypothetical protein
MTVARKMVQALGVITAGTMVLAVASAQAAPEQQASNRGLEMRDATLRLAAFPNQVADVAGGSQVDGAKTVQWVLSGAPNQRWETEASLDGYYRFKSYNSGMCLNVIDASGADGAPVIQHTCGGAPNELWKPLRRIIGYQLINKNSGKCLAVGGGAGQGHPLIQFGCSPNGDPSDVWLAVWEPPFI